MDSYGIHASQMAAGEASNHVADLNSIINNHNQTLLSGFYTKEKKDKSGDKTQIEENEGLLGKGIVSAGLAIKSGNDLINKYNGLSGAISRGTSENVYNLSAGRIGSGQVIAGVKMGPAEQIARTTAKTSGLTPGQAQGSIARAQRSDTYIGRDGSAAKITPGELSDASKEITVGESMVAPRVADESLDLLGKTVKKGLTTIGTEAGVATRIGATAGGALSAAGAIYTGVEDFGEGKWKSEGSVTKAGDIFSIAGGVLGTAATVAPVLAPLAGIADLTGSVLDLIGGKIDDAKKEGVEGGSAPALTQNVVQRSTAGQTAQQSGQSSLQQLQNRGGGGSY